LTGQARHDSLEEGRRHVTRILPAGQHYGTFARQSSGDGFALYRTRYPASARYPTHGNELASLLFLDTGHCTKRISARDLELGRGSMMFLPSGRLQADWFPVATTFIAAEIDEPMLARLRDAGASLTEHAQLAPGEARDLGARLRRELAEADAVSPLILESILLNALASATRHQTPRRLRRPSWLTRAKELLHDRALESPRLGDIAAAVGVHPGHLSREFRRFFGVVPGEYLRQLRIDFAARQLVESDTPMGEIALAAGFTDQAHFARAFRRAMGTTPRGHRQLARAQAR
jgi:AraC family transcriptional regulator